MPIGIMEGILIIKAVKEITEEVIEAVQGATEKFGDGVEVQTLEGMEGEWQSSEEIKEEVDRNDN